MKKNLIIILTFFIAFSTMIGSVSAKSWANSGNQDSRQTSREDLRQKMQENRESLLKNRENLREEFKAGSVDAAGQLATLHAIRVEKRGSFYYERLLSILKRLDTAIKDAESKYGTSKLANSRSLWTQADSKLKSGKTLMDSAISAFKTIKGEKVQDLLPELRKARELAKQSWSAYKDSSKLMKDSAKALKTVIRSSRPSPSPKTSGSPRLFKPNATPVVPPPIN